MCSTIASVSAHLVNSANCFSDNNLSNTTSYIYDNHDVTIFKYKINFIFGIIFYYMQINIQVVWYNLTNSYSSVVSLYQQFVFAFSSSSSLKYVLLSNAYYNILGICTSSTGITSQYSSGQATYYLTDFDLTHIEISGIQQISLPLIDIYKIVREVSCISYLRKYFNNNKLS